MPRKPRPQVVSARPDRAVAGVGTIKEYQRTPKQLLDQYCSRSKRPRPLYRQIKCRENASLYLARVVLRDPKGDDEKNIVLIPSGGYSSPAEAEHAAALIALHRVDGARQHETKLPEPFRSAWLALCGRQTTAQASEDTTKDFVCVICGKDFAKDYALETHLKSEHKTSSKKLAEEAAEAAEDAEEVVVAPAPAPLTQLAEGARSKYSSEFERRLVAEARVVKKNVREQRAQIAEDAIPTLRLTSEHRSRLGELLRSRGVLVDSSRDTNTTTEHAASVRHSLLELGFSSSSVSAALAATATQEDALTYLLVHTREEALPTTYHVKGSQFDMRGDDAEAAHSAVIPGGSVENDFEALSYAFEDVSRASSVCFKLPRGATARCDGDVWRVESSNRRVISAIAARLEEDDDDESSASAIVDALQQYTEEAEAVQPHRRAAPRKSAPTRRAPTRTRTRRAPGYMQSVRDDARRNPLAKQRAALPSAARKHAVLQAIASSPVTLIAGETGCGKTTQIPQFVFEDALAREIDVNVACTQPRRLAAISVAGRVSEEIGVPSVVGYHIRGENTTSPQSTVISFCTTGILLRKLQLSPAETLRGYTHIFVDEVHERSLDSDLLLALLKKYVLENDTCDTKIVLMSATLDVGIFATYFGEHRVSVVDIEGRTFPVAVEHLPDVEHLLGNDFYAESQALLRAVARGASTCDDGGILVFVAGLKEIDALVRELNRDNAYHALPLHGSLKPADQRRVFARAPAGRIKVVVSTNVAETSLTIPDIVVVVDSGRENQASYDAQWKMSVLRKQWVSCASMEQRKGRAGRVRSGLCIRVFPASLKTPSHSLPEISRVPLHSLALRVLDVTNAPKRFVSALISPPNITSFDAALSDLSHAGCITVDFELTALGRILAVLPVDPFVGKTLVYGSLLGIGDHSAVCAASNSLGKSLFSTRVEDRPGVKEIQRVIHRKHVFCASSDQSIVVWASHKFRATKNKRKFCEDHFLIESRMRDLEKLRIEYLRAISDYFTSRNFIGESSPSIASLQLLRAALCAGSYPNIVQIDRTKKKFVKTASGAVEKSASASRDLKLYDLSSNSKQKVFIHPSSLLADEVSATMDFLSYEVKMKTSAVFVKNISVVPLLSVALMCCSNITRTATGISVDDGRVSLKAKPLVAALTLGAKRLLDRVLDCVLEREDVDVEALELLKALLVSGGVA